MPGSRSWRRIALLPVFWVLALAGIQQAPLPAEPAREKSEAPAARTRPHPWLAGSAAAEEPALQPRPRRTRTLLAQQQGSPSPFEDIPEAQEGQEPPSPFEDIEEAEEEAPPQAQPAGDFIEDVEFRGARRIPRESLMARIFVKPGDIYDEDALRRDFMVLWNTGFFDDLRLEVEDGERGKIVRFIVTERRIVRTIRYEGNKSATLSDILERFKERDVGLTVESRYDPTRVQRAIVVLKQLLGERGRQYAEIEPQVRQIPPSSVEIVFNIDEGPKVKVGEINIEGNEVMSDGKARSKMKRLSPIGIPYSIIFENMFKKTFDIQKLEEDKERLRNAYQIEGYFKATVTHHDLDIRDKTGRKMFPLPFIWKKKGKLADVTVYLEEGRQYQLGRLSFSDVELFRTPEAVLGQVFQMQQGEIFNVEKLRQGLENMKKLYGEFGYIDFVAEPSFEFREDRDPALIDLNLAVDEGKQFFVRRIGFEGNTTTRDKVIRRELLLDEGDMFNTRLWDMSILRLNQLGYFEPLKEDESTDIRRDTRQGLVDLTLNVKERGKNQVNLNGGVSGFAGSFIGFGYSTNNFLGLGETLTFETQLGSRERVLMFGFTEPYLFGRPIQAGFTVFTRRFDFDQGREASILSGRDLSSVFQSLGQDNLLNFRQNSDGFTTFVSYPLKKSFTRLSLTYKFQRDDITPFGASATNLFSFQNFRGVTGPNSLDGITTSEITPGYFFNTVNHPINPTRGRSLFANVAIAGIGGNTRFIQPTVEAKYFKQIGGGERVLAMRGMFSTITGFGGKVPPTFRRQFMGGENDIRGFTSFSITPIAWIPDMAQVPVRNDDGTQRTQVQIVQGVPREVPVLANTPVFRPTFPGGDTRFVYNVEYRIPLFGPVTLAPFFDIGFNKILFDDQLRLNSGRVDQLNAEFPQAGFERNIEVISDTQNIRGSTGIEFQVMMPVVNAPFRFYWAYNPFRVERFLQPPVVADRSQFGNQSTFINSIAPFGTALPFFEDATTFRFTISRTF